MTTTFQERLQKAAISLQEDRLADSITEYTAALDEAGSIQQRIDLIKVLGRLHQKAKRPAEAISAFQSVLELYEKMEDTEAGADVAAVHNNLAAVLISADVSGAIEQYKKALEIYKALFKEKEGQYGSHLANTHFALAEALLLQKESKMAKAHFKEAIRIYENAPELAEFRARAHYQLGLIYTDEFNLHDAKIQYLKALSAYDSLPGFRDLQNRAIRAALYNNLGVTYNSLEEGEKAIASYERSLEMYGELMESHAEIFLPYEASTLSSLGIAYSEMKEMQKAIDFMQESIDRYHTLADTHPEQYTHYLATSLHNQGLFFIEERDLDKAEHFFREALALRRKIASGQPEQFGPDACATALNLVELYQIKLEATLNMDLQKKSLALLKEVHNRLVSLDDDRLVIENMRADCASQLEYFSKIDLEELVLHYVKLKSNALREKMYETVDPLEKLVHQKELTRMLQEKYEEFSSSEPLKSMLTQAFNDMAWLLIRLGKTREARSCLKKGREFDPGLDLFMCNLGHCELLENAPDKAMVSYTQFLGKDVENTDRKTDILRKDLAILRRDGVITQGKEELENRLFL
jgi:tetratricopeptide (TPR) repeat protein